LRGVTNGALRAHWAAGIDRNARINARGPLGDSKLVAQPPDNVLLIEYHFRGGIDDDGSGYAHR
jgi:hypothetical protein